MNVMKIAIHFFFSIRIKYIFRKENINIVDVIYNRKCRKMIKLKHI